MKKHLEINQSMQKHNNFCWGKGVKIALFWGVLHSFSTVLSSRQAARCYTKACLKSTDFS